MINQIEKDNKTKCKEEIIPKMKFKDKKLPY